MASHDPTPIGTRVRLVSPGSNDDGLIGTVVEINPTFAAGLVNPWPYEVEIVGPSGRTYRLRLAVGEFVAAEDKG